MGAVRLDVDEPAERLHELPVLPEVHARLAIVLEDRGASLWDVERVVRLDPVLSTRVLHLAASSAVGRRRQATTVAEAVRLVGFDALADLAFGTGVGRAKPGDPIGPLPHRRFWLHCLATAAFSRRLALLAGEDQPEEHWVAGLLHDLGKLVHARFSPDGFRVAIEIAASRDVSLLEAEVEALGAGHDRTGGVLAQRWGLPPTVQRAIAHHHSPSPTAPAAHEHVVHCANLMAVALDLGWSGDRRLPAFAAHAWDRLGLSISHVEPLVRDTRRELDAQAAGVLGGHAA